MQAQITIAAAADTVRAWIADPKRVAHWLPDLARERDAPSASAALPALQKDAEGVSWSFAPAGRMDVTGDGDTATITLTLADDTAPAADPTEPESPAEAAEHAITAALRSIKSHIEATGGGDPTLSPPGVSAKLYGHTATNDPVI